MICTKCGRECICYPDPPSDLQYTRAYKCCTCHVVYTEWQTYENRELRKALWMLNPDFPMKAYGDDGEMQIFPYDYKRDDVKVIINATLVAVRKTREQLSKWERLAQSGNPHVADLVQANLELIEANIDLERRLKEKYE